MPSLIETIAARSQTEREKRIAETEGLDQQAKVVLAVLADTADAMDRMAEKNKDARDGIAALLDFAAKEMSACFERAFHELEGWGLL